MQPSELKFLNWNLLFLYSALIQKEILIQFSPKFHLNCCKTCICFVIIIYKWNIVEKTSLLFNIKNRSRLININYVANTTAHSTRSRGVTMLAWSWPCQNMLINVAVAPSLHHLMNYSQYAVRHCILLIMYFVLYIYCMCSFINLPTLMDLEPSGSFHPLCKTTSAMGTAYFRYIHIYLLLITKKALHTTCWNKLYIFLLILHIM